MQLSWMYFTFNPLYPKLDLFPKSIPTLATFCSTAMDHTVVGNETYSRALKVTFETRLSKITE